MEQIIMGTCIIVGLVSICYQSKWYQKKSNDEFMSLESTKAIKGIIAILIIIHHITIIGIQIEPLMGMQYVGYLLVGVFFLYSGYGLMKSVKTKENYLKGFITKRIPAILVPFFVMNSLYLLVLSVCFGRTYSILEILNYVLGIQLINSYAWYTIMILVFYLAFYFFFKIFKEKKAVILIGIFILLSIVFCMKFVGVQWFLSSLSFFIGILLAYQERRILEWVKKKYLLCLLIVLFATIGCFLLGFVLVESAIVNQLTAVVCNFFFTLTVIVVNMKLQIKNEITIFLGNISYEIYLVHKLVLFIMLGYLNKIGPTSYMILCIGVSVILAYGIHQIDKKLLKQIAKI